MKRNKSTRDDFILEVCEAIRMLGKQSIQPREAMIVCQQLAASYRGLSPQLLWRSNAALHTVDYAVLLNEPDGTLCLFFAPSRLAPWTLHWAQHFREGDVVSVNGCVLRVATAMAHLLLSPDARCSPAEYFVDLLLIESAVRERGISPSKLDCDLASESFLTVGTEDQSAEVDNSTPKLGVGAYEQYAYWIASRRLLRSDCTNGTKEFYEKHRTWFDTFRCVHITVRSKQAAERMRSMDGETILKSVLKFPSPSLWEDISNVMVHSKYRHELSSRKITTSGNDAKAPHDPGVCETIIEFALDESPSNFDEKTEEHIRDYLFAEWLAEQRRTAVIEWFIGERVGECN